MNQTENRELIAVLAEVKKEVRAAEKKHGQQLDVPLGFSSQFAGAAEAAKQSTDGAFRAGYGTWMHIAYEEAMETFAEEDPAKARAEALQAAAMFVQIVRKIDFDREQANPLKPEDRVRDDDMGWGTVKNVQPDNEALGPVALVRWDHGPSGEPKLIPHDLVWVKRLERVSADASSEAV